jgi:hypothetical protein
MEKTLSFEWKKLTLSDYSHSFESDSSSDRTEKEFSRPYSTPSLRDDNKNEPFHKTRKGCFSCW